MTKPWSKHSVTAATLLLAPVCWSQTNDVQSSESVPPVTLETPRGQLNRIGLNYRMGLNISVNFKNLGGLQLTDPGPAFGGRVNRNYDNGYNRVDSANNRDNLTWYWGYTSPNSVQGGNLALQSDATPPTASSGRYADFPQHGVELTYDRELARGKHWRAGAEAGLGYTAISITDSRTLTYFANRTSDAYALNGVVPPMAPYSGTYYGPGPLIPSIPSDRTITTLFSAASIRGDRKIDCDFFTIRLGPYLEIPLSSKFAAILGGGLTLGIANTEFTFHETVNVSDPAYGINLNSGPRSGSGSQTDFMVGGYAGASLSYALSDNIKLLAGAMFQAAGTAINNKNGKQSVLDLGKSVIISVGASYLF